MCGWCQEQLHQSRLRRRIEHECVRSVSLAGGGRENYASGTQVVIESSLSQHGFNMQDALTVHMFSYTCVQLVGSHHSIHYVFMTHRNAASCNSLVSLSSVHTARPVVLPVLSLISTEFSIVCALLVAVMSNETEMVEEEELQSVSWALARRATLKVPVQSGRPTPAWHGAWVHGNITWSVMVMYDDAHGDQKSVIIVITVPAARLRTG